MAAKLDAKYQLVPISDLRFDPENPRLGGVARNKTQEQIQKYLEGPPNYALDLVGSIAENGFLPYEPLIVRRDNGKYIVIEGNRRLAAVQAILSAPAKFGGELLRSLEEIPVLVFADDKAGRDSEEVLRYLGVKHLFGFRDWPPTSKAMFLDGRAKSKGDLAQVLKELNIKRGEAARYLIPYRLMKSTKKAFKGVETEDFWSLAESFGRKNIRGYVQLDVDRRALRIRGFDAKKMRYLAQFLYGAKRRVTDTRQLSSLSKVLGSPIAARKLEKGAPLEEAMLYVEPKRETIATLQRQLEKIFEKIRKLSPGKEDSARLLTVVEEFSRKLKK